MNRASPTRRAYIEPAKAVGYLPIVDFKHDLAAARLQTRAGDFRRLLIQRRRATNRTGADSGRFPGQ
ncbi:MAG: hypothetical protein ACREMQ_21405 [Longimicrobiales bacterium]